LSAAGRTAKAKKLRSWRSLLIPAVLAFAALIALGTWQVERKAWKESLIAAMTVRLDAPPEALPAPATWPKLNRAADEFRRVMFTAEFDTAREAFVYSGASALRPDTSGAGFWIFTPARLPDGAVVIVNRGFMPLLEAKTLSNPVIHGTVDITGVMRWPETPHWFTPKANPQQSVWFVRDPSAIAAAKGLGSVAPFFVEQESPVPPGGWPQPGKLVPNLPNNHLQYAVTWYGVALALVVVFFAWAVKTARERRS
jgi:surfeit locus 1 family protein